MGLITYYICDRCHDTINEGMPFHLTAPWIEYYWCAKCAEEFRQWAVLPEFKIDLPD